jgi:chitin disaccharide deacetylase
MNRESLTLRARSLEPERESVSSRPVATPQIDRLGLVPRLIVNADDFGLTHGVNRAIIELHQAGVLTSTTLMANAAASDEAIQLALANPSLGVGCHIVLVDGAPVLSPSAIPNLTRGSGGTFRTSLGRFVRDVYSPGTKASSRPTLAAEIEAEATAQIRLLQSRGLCLTHVDTHKHTHMFPAVLRPILRAARACGITRIRNPFDSAWSRRKASGVPWLRRAQIAVLSRLETHVLRIIAEHGFTTTDGTISVMITGSLNADSLRRTLAGMPEGTWELVTHPGYYDADLDAVHTRLKAEREIERQALTALEQFPRIELIGFAALASSGLAPNGASTTVSS